MIEPQFAQQPRCWFEKKRGPLPESRPKPAERTKIRLRTPATWRVLFWRLSDGFFKLAFDRLDSGAVSFDFSRDLGDHLRILRGNIELF